MNMQRLAVRVAILCLAITPAMAANDDSHTVTVDVVTINELAITGGNVTLTINAAVAGADPTNDTDVSTTLAWTSNDTNTKKITVATDINPTYTLTVQATATAGGTGLGAKTLTLAAGAQDFVGTIAQTVGNCTLTYTASATAALGTGTDVHTVTYTLVDQ